MMYRSVIEKVAPSMIELASAGGAVVVEKPAAGQEARKSSPKDG
jgi:hypothetical protein